MLNHGFDGDCDCWNTQREPNENGEFPIVYYEATSGEICNSKYDFSCFAFYLEHLCRSHAINLVPQHIDLKTIAADRRERYQEVMARYERMQSLLAPYEIDTNPN